MSALRRLASRTYVWIFGRPSTQAINDRLLHLVLKGRGYNNGPHPRDTGEERFVRLLGLTNPRFCIDIGANRGAYSALLLQHTNAEVLAFEPLPTTFEHLRKLSLTYPDRFSAENNGVGDSDSELELHYGEDTALASFSREVNEIDYVGSTNVNSVTVPVFSLDSYLAQHGRIKEVDFIKIDTEGFEYEVLQGARDTIAELRPKFIQIEFNWHQLVKSHTLYSIGRQFLHDYDLYQILPFGSVLARREIDVPDTNIFCFSNFVFIRRDLIADGTLQRQMGIEL